MLIDAFMSLFSNTSATYCDLSTKEKREFTNNCLSRTFVLLQKHLKPDLSLEIGARDAAFSRELKANLPSTYVVAFEASPMYHKIWSELHHYDQIEVEYLNLAVSDHCGTVKFNQPIDLVNFEGAGIGSLYSRVDGAFKGIKEEVVETQAITLDSYLETTTKENIALWIDVEGALKEVFSGLQKTFASTRKGGISSIFIEVESKARWREQWLDRDVFSFLIDNGFIPIARDFQYVEQYNVIFIRGDLIGEKIWGLVSDYHHQCQKTRLRPNMKFNDVWIGFQLSLGRIFLVGTQKYHFSSLTERHFIQVLHERWDRRLHYEILYDTKDMRGEYLDISLHAEFNQQINKAIFQSLDLKQGVLKSLIKEHFTNIPIDIFYEHKINSSHFTLRVPFTPIGSMAKYCELLLFFIGITHSLCDTSCISSVLR